MISYLLVYLLSYNYTDNNRIYGIIDMEELLITSFPLYVCKRNDSDCQHLTIHSEI